MRCGLLGEHLGHSWSPRIHQFLGDYSYELFEVAPENLDNFLKAAPFYGVNVTIPYKKAVLPRCAELSPAARAMGCVNTLLKRKDGTLLGDNTDVDGFRCLLSRNGGIRPGEKALVLGTGGASGTVQTVLRSLGAKVIPISRSGSDNYENYAQHQDAVLLINATPVGMYPRNGEVLIDLKKLPKLRCVLDLVYNPLRTRLLLDAEDLQIPCENGLSMLVAQAEKAAELFTGAPVSGDVFHEILDHLNREMQNIILIGMPGCGKTTVGQKLAQALDRPFYDADAELEKHAGCTVPDYFSQYGEASFRGLETEVLKDLGKKNGCVIATGGGCVTREENRNLLRQNGLLVRLSRDLNRLASDGRPVTAAKGLQQLFAEREPLYAGFADVTVDNNGSVSQTVKKILEVLR